MKKLKGFTLLEIVLTLSIIAIIAMIAIPSFAGARLKAEVVAHNSNVRAIETAAYLYLSDNKDVTSGNIKFDNIKQYLNKDDVIPGSFTETNEFTITYDSSSNKVVVTPGEYKMVDGKAEKVD